MAVGANYAMSLRNVNYPMSIAHLLNSSMQLFNYQLLNYPMGVPDVRRW
jgi:hypothetical protein